MMLEKQEETGQEAEWLLNSPCQTTMQMIVLQSGRAEPPV